MTSTSYTIKLPQFEGPFDLLLFFIERDELDIHNIPIAKITMDFLNYIRTMESLNINLASEFMVMAATLMQIKTKMLLPRKPKNEDGDEIDPRQDLVLKLLEYKKYKAAIEDFQQMEDKRSNRYIRGHASLELDKIVRRAEKSSEIESIKLFRLMDVFNKLMEELESKKNNKNPIILRFDYDLQTEKKNLLDKLIKKSYLKFKEVFHECKDRIQAIVIFLSLLELVNDQELKLESIGTINHFVLKKSTS
jgi:segregation and condensation protein A